MADDQTILYNKENGIGIITINRPEKMNAITGEMSRHLHEIRNNIILDDEVRVVIITGVGHAFCGGTDVSAIQLGQSRTEREEPAARPPENLPQSPLPNWTFTRIPKPTIAAVNGAAVGMGAEWVAQCDFRVASEHARFGWVFSQRGLTPDLGSGPYLLPYIVGLTKALDLMYSVTLFTSYFLLLSKLDFGLHL